LIFAMPWNGSMPHAPFVPLALHRLQYTVSAVVSF
jgi:hypothetical protein